MIEYTGRSAVKSTTNSHKCTDFSHRFNDFQMQCICSTTGAKTQLNRAGERKPYIMYPMKIQNREFFGLNMKFSMCRDYTKNFSKIAPSGKGEKNPENIQVIRTILLRISKLASKLEIFKMIVRITCIFSVFFSPFPDGAILEFFFVQSLHILNFMFKPKTHRFGFSSGT